MPNISRCWVTAAPNPTYKTLRLNCKQPLAPPNFSRFAEEGNLQCKQLLSIVKKHLSHKRHFHRISGVIEHFHVFYGDGTE